MKPPLYLGDHAALTPDKPAVINGSTGAVLSYRELDERSMRLAQLLHAHGLRRGDHIAMLMENNIRCFEICWAALRSGLLITPVNRFVSVDEALYIVADCEARAIVSSFAMAEVARQLTGHMPGCGLRLMVDGTIDGWDSLEDVIAAHPAEPLADQWLGGMMMYSSGTTGRPKGILRAQAPGLVTEGAGGGPRDALFKRFGIDADSIYMTPAPLYHAAPLGYAVHMQFIGGTAVFMEKFEPLAALSMIERYRVTHSQWVPTMFIRMLKLREEERESFDLSSHVAAIHAAAPCPAEIKRQMIDWWGPIVFEYYGGSEGNGLTSIDSQEAMQRPGSVGKALVGTIRICDEQGEVLPPGGTGLVYFEREALPFRYHNDPEKTRAAQHPAHPTWTAIGDIGHVDEDGYLYLTDRQSFMIISGGVNIYPQMVEDALVLHPAVFDVAVIGVPDAEMGEAVKAVVEVAPGVPRTAALAEELIAFVRGKVSRYMVPRSVDFIDVMPRMPTGKLSKRLLRERYWQEVSSS